MLTRRLKRQVFLLEWLNICGVAYYFNYLFFLTRDRFGFTNAENLLLAAVNGFFYIIAAWLGGKFAQKHGYFFALKVGFIVMFLALAAGSVFTTARALYPVMIIWTFGTCFTWPALEALAADNETRSGLCRMIGLYNLTWAGGAAVAYFTGGTLLHLLRPHGAACDPGHHPLAPGKERKEDGNIFFGNACGHPGTSAASSPCRNHKSVP